MESKKYKTGGWLSFIIAGLIYLGGYWLLTGEIPGSSGVLKWWTLLILLLLWGSVDYFLSSLRKANSLCCVCGNIVGKHNRLQCHICKKIVHKKNCAMMDDNGVSCCRNCYQAMPENVKHSIVTETEPRVLSEPAQAFLDSVSDNIKNGTIKDQFGDPLEPLNNNEFQAIAQCMMQLAQQGGAELGFRCYLEIDQDSRKTVVALLGLLPIVGSDAKARSMSVLYVVADSGSLSRARNDYRAYKILSHSVEFMTWDDLERVLASGHKAKDLWILGDLDWKTRPIEDHEKLMAMEKAMDAIISNKKACAIFMHQAGCEPVTNLLRLKGL